MAFIVLCSSHLNNWVEKSIYVGLLKYLYKLFGYSSKAQTKRCQPAWWPSHHIHSASLRYQKCQQKKRKVFHSSMKIHKQNESWLSTFIRFQTELTHLTFTYLHFPCSTASLLVFCISVGKKKPMFFWTSKPQCINTDARTPRRDKERPPPGSQRERLC